MGKGWSSKTSTGSFERSYEEKMYIDPNLTPYTKTDPRWTAELNTEGKQ